MSLVDKIKKKLLEARKAKNEFAKNVLSVVLGDIQVQEGRAVQKGEITEGQAEKIVQKLIKSNQETMTAIREVLSKGFDAEKASQFGKLETENEILAKLLPKACTREEIKDFLLFVLDKVKEPRSDGQATGIAMKLLAALEGSKDGKLVAEIVKELRL